MSDKKNKKSSDPGIEKHGGYQPLNEGYQPAQKGDTPPSKASLNSLPRPPKGGTGESPDQASASDEKK